MICFPRNCDSIAFYLRRNDLPNIRSRFTHHLVEKLEQHPKTVVLLTHRESLQALRFLLPGSLKIVETHSFQQSPEKQNILDRWIGSTPWGLCDLAVVERVHP